MVSAKALPIKRAKISVPPPGGNVTVMLMARLGKLSAESVACADALKHGLSRHRPNAAIDSVRVKRGRVRQLGRGVFMWGSAKKKGAMTALIFGAGDGFVNQIQMLVFAGDIVWQRSG